MPRLEKETVPTKEFNETDELRARLNKLADGYQFDATFFTQLHQGASLIWKDETEKELELLIRYVNEEKTVKNPLGFIKSKITSAWEISEAGGKITFADLQPVKERWAGREEKLPEWFATKDEPYEPAEPDPELEKMKEKMLKKWANKKRSMLKRMSLNRKITKSPTLFFSKREERSGIFYYLFDSRKSTYALKNRERA
ncbi:hypothetical protein FK545_20060 (plasmid) [Planococcus glaciei]|nr:hypothetical protein [Planococcus glaciei]QDY46914.1 hypothetical protein FK545_20060 [Planococcus glaciei]